MTTCARCDALLRSGARFCTRCGAPAAVDGVVLVEERVVVEDDAVADDGASAAASERASEGVPVIAAEVPPLSMGRRWSAPPVRSHAATMAFITGLLPLFVSLLGNTIAAVLTADAAAQASADAASGAWTPVFVTLALVFVINAALLTVCGIAAGRGVRETANGVTLGRSLAVAGLVVGGLNLLLWLAGLVVTLTTLAAAFG